VRVTAFCLQRRGNIKAVIDGPGPLAVLAARLLFQDVRRQNLSRGTGWRRRGLPLLSC
jgi:hypothetical protein